MPKLEMGDSSEKINQIFSKVNLVVKLLKFQGSSSNSFGDTFLTRFHKSLHYTGNNSGKTGLSLDRTACLNLLLSISS